MLFLLVVPLTVFAQQDTVKSRFLFDGDFRFRAEQDWDSRKSDGSFRDDRSRLRYRLRAGVTYRHNWSEVGARLRTGVSRKQQDPQLTLGDGFNEFGTLPIALEKAYFSVDRYGFHVWLGKNTYPFEKRNELFWSDNVYPEGVFLRKVFDVSGSFIEKLEVNGGHFIINTRGSSFEEDSYFQGFQISTSFLENNIEIYPSVYLFKNIQNIPDGAATFFFDYSILHLGTTIKPFRRNNLSAEFDYYRNLEDYRTNDSIAPAFKNQKNGWVAGVSLGRSKKKKDLRAKLTYMQMQRYAAVDFLAQNDWARWDYSSFGSPDGRLTNYKGFELVGSYMLQDNMKFTIKYYWVEQLVPLGDFLETGQRIRFDIDIKI